MSNTITAEMINTVQDLLSKDKQITGPPQKMWMNQKMIDEIKESAKQVKGSEFPNGDGIQFPVGPLCGIDVFLDDTLPNLHWRDEAGNLYPHSDTDKEIKAEGRRIDWTRQFVVIILKDIDDQFKKYGVYKGSRTGFGDGKVIWSISNGKAYRGGAITGDELMVYKELPNSSTGEQGLRQSTE